jgi:gluconokinase
MVVIIFGVSGAGKTTIGQLLADELGWRFYEADDFHSQVNIDKMRQGVPLTDEDRWPWLENLGELIKRCVAAGENAALACSALKEAYRRRLRVNADVKLVFLRGDYELIASQLRQRHGPFHESCIAAKSVRGFRRAETNRGRSGDPVGSDSS